MNWSVLIMMLNKFYETYGRPAETLYITETGWNTIINDLMNMQSFNGDAQTRIDEIKKLPTTIKINGSQLYVIKYTGPNGNHVGHGTTVMSQEEAEELNHPLDLPKADLDLVDARISAMRRKLPIDEETPPVSSRLYTQGSGNTGVLTMQNLERAYAQAMQAAENQQWFGMLGGNNNINNDLRAQVSSSNRDSAQTANTSTPWWRTWANSYSSGGQNE